MLRPMSARCKPLCSLFCFAARARNKKRRQGRRCEPAPQRPPPKRRFLSSLLRYFIASLIRPFLTSQTSSHALPSPPPTKSPASQSSQSQIPPAPTDTQRDRATHIESDSSAPRSKFPAD